MSKCSFTCITKFTDHLDFVTFLLLFICAMKKQKMAWNSSEISYLIVCWVLFVHLLGFVFVLLIFFVVVSLFLFAKRSGIQTVCILNGNWEETFLGAGCPTASCYLLHLSWSTDLPAASTSTLGCWTNSWSTAGNPRVPLGSAATGLPIWDIQALGTCGLPSRRWRHWLINIKKKIIFFLTTMLQTSSEAALMLYLWMPSSLCSL